MAFRTVPWSFEVIKCDHKRATMDGIFMKDCTGQRNKKARARTRCTVQVISPEIQHIGLKNSKAQAKRESSGDVRVF